MKLIESDRISLYDYVMHFYIHLLTKTEMINYKQCSKLSFYSVHCSGAEVYKLCTRGFSYALL